MPRMLPTKYRIIDYPHGARKVVGTVHVANYMESFEGIVWSAQVHARLTGRYLDIEIVDGIGVATVGPEGRIS